MLRSGVRGFGESGARRRAANVDAPSIQESMKPPGDKASERRSALAFLKTTEIFASGAIASVKLIESDPPIEYRGAVPGRDRGFPRVSALRSGAAEAFQWRALGESNPSCQIENLES